MVNEKAALDQFGCLLKLSLSMEIEGWQMTNNKLQRFNRWGEAGHGRLKNVNGLLGF